MGKDRYSAGVAFYFGSLFLREKFRLMVDKLLNEIDMGMVCGLWSWIKYDWEERGKSA